MSRNKLLPDDLIMERDGRVIAVRPGAFFKRVNQGYRPITDRAIAVRRWREQHPGGAEISPEPPRQRYIDL